MSAKRRRRSFIQRHGCEKVSIMYFLLRSTKFNAYFHIFQYFFLMQNLFKSRSRGMPVWKSVQNVFYDWSVAPNNFLHFPVYVFKRQVLLKAREARVWKSVHYVFLLGLQQIHSCKHKRRFRWSGYHLYFMHTFLSRYSLHKLFRFEEKNLSCPNTKCTKWTHFIHCAVNPSDVSILLMQISSRYKTI